MNPVLELARAAAALKDQHGDLLRGEPAHARPDVADAFDRARQRIVGDQAPQGAQLTLDPPAPVAWVCERHPALPFGHDDCESPGMLHADAVAVGLLAA